MTVADKEFAREFARLSIAFVAQLPSRVEILSDDLAACLSAPHDVALFEKLSHEVHQLKGAGSTFGCSGISDAAGALEQRLAALRAETTTVAASTADEVEAAMETLRGEAHRVFRESTQSGQPGIQT